MKNVIYESFKSLINNKKSTGILNNIDRRAPRRRPREQTESEVLANLAALSWNKAIASGKLQKKGDRHYSLKINEREIKET